MKRDIRALNRLEGTIQFVPEDSILLTEGTGGNIEPENTGEVFYVVILSKFAVCLSETIVIVLFVSSLKEEFVTVGWNT